MGTIFTFCGVGVGVGVAMVMWTDFGVGLGVGVGLGLGFAFCGAGVGLCAFVGAETINKKSRKTLYARMRLKQPPMAEYPVSGAACPVK